jgi:hypothetical protein
LGMEEEKSERKQPPRAKGEGKVRFYALYFA